MHTIQRYFRTQGDPNSHNSRQADTQFRQAQRRAYDTNDDSESSSSESSERLPVNFDTSDDEESNEIVNVSLDMPNIDHLPIEIPVLQLRGSRSSSRRNNNGEVDNTAERTIEENTNPQDIVLSNVRDSSLLDQQTFQDNMYKKFLIYRQYLILKSKVFPGLYHQHHVQRIFHFYNDWNLYSRDYYNFFSRYNHAFEYSSLILQYPHVARRNSNNFGLNSALCEQPRQLFRLHNSQFRPNFYPYSLFVSEQPYLNNYETHNLNIENGTELSFSDFSVVNSDIANFRNQENFTPDSIPYNFSSEINVQNYQSTSNQIQSAEHETYEINREPNNSQLNIQLNAGDNQDNQDNTNCIDMVKTENNFEVEGIKLESITPEPILYVNEDDYDFEVVNIADLLPDPFEQQFNNTVYNKLNKKITWFRLPDEYIETDSDFTPDDIEVELICNSIKGVPYYPRRFIHRDKVPLIFVEPVDSMQTFSDLTFIKPTVIRSDYIKEPPFFSCPLLTDPLCFSSTSAFVFVNTALKNLNLLESNIESQRENIPVSEKNLSESSTTDSVPQHGTFQEHDANKNILEKDNENTSVETTTLILDAADQKKKSNSTKLSTNTKNISSDHIETISAMNVNKSFEEKNGLLNIQEDEDDDTEENTIENNIVGMIRNVTSLSDNIPRGLKEEISTFTLIENRTRESCNSERDSCFSYSDSATLDSSVDLFTNSAMYEEKIAEILDSFDSQNNLHTSSANISPVGAIIEREIIKISERYKAADCQTDIQNVLFSSGKKRKIEFEDEIPEKIPKISKNNFITVRPLEFLTENNNSSNTTLQRTLRNELVCQETFFSAENDIPFLPISSDVESIHIGNNTNIQNTTSSGDMELQVESSENVIPFSSTSLSFPNIITCEEPNCVPLNVHMNQNLLENYSLREYSETEVIKQNINNIYNNRMASNNNLHSLQSMNNHMINEFTNSYISNNAERVIATDFSPNAHLLPQHSFPLNVADDSINNDISSLLNEISQAHDSLNKKLEIDKNSNQLPLFIKTEESTSANVQSSSLQSDIIDKQISVSLNDTANNEPSENNVHFEPHPYVNLADQEITRTFIKRDATEIHSICSTMVGDESFLQCTIQQLMFVTKRLLKQFNITRKYKTRKKRMRWTKKPKSKNISGQINSGNDSLACNKSSPQLITALKKVEGFLLELMRVLLVEFPELNWATESDTSAEIRKLDSAVIKSIWNDLLALQVPCQTSTMTHCLLFLTFKYFDLEKGSVRTNPENIIISTSKPSGSNQEDTQEQKKMDVDQNLDDENILTGNITQVLQWSSIKKRGQRYETIGELISIDVKFKIMVLQQRSGSVIKVLYGRNDECNFKIGTYIRVVGTIRNRLMKAHRIIKSSRTHFMRMQNSRKR